MNKSSKRFRFDSFATEFSEDKQDIPDNDSGIGKFLNCDNFDELDYVNELCDSSCEIMQ